MLFFCVWGYYDKNAKPNHKNLPYHVPYLLRLTNFNDSYKPMGFSGKF